MVRLVGILLPRRLKNFRIGCVPVVGVRITVARSAAVSLCVGQVCESGARRAVLLVSSCPPGPPLRFITMDTDNVRPSGGGAGSGCTLVWIIAKGYDDRERETNKIVTDLRDSAQLRGYSRKTPMQLAALDVADGAGGAPGQAPLNHASEWQEWSRAL